MIGATAWLAVGCVAAAFALFIAIAPVRPIISLGIVIWAGEAAWFNPLPPGGSAAAGALLLGAGSIKSRLMNEGSRREWYGLWFPVLAPFVGIVLAPWLIEGTRTATWAAAQVLAMGIVTILATRWVTPASMLQACYNALTFLAACSLLMWVLGLADPAAQHRFSGVTSNPNHLAILAFLWAALAFSLGPLKVRLSVPPAVLLVVLSGSRGGAIALAAVLMAGFWVRGSSETSSRLWTRRLITAVSAAALCAFVYSAVRRSADYLEPSLEILRSDDSGRLNAIQMARQQFMDRPLTGYGFGVLSVNEDPGGHTWLATIAVQLGILGVALCVLFVVALLRTPWRSSPGLAALTFGTLASLVSESWILGAGAATTATFWLALGALTSRPKFPDGPARSASASQGAVNREFPTTHVHTPDLRWRSGPGNAMMEACS